MGTQVFAILPGAARDAELTLDQGALLAANLREATSRRSDASPSRRPARPGPLTLVARTAIRGSGLAARPGGFSTPGTRPAAARVAVSPRR